METIANFKYAQIPALDAEVAMIPYTVSYQWYLERLAITLCQRIDLRKIIKKYKKLQSVNTK